MKLNGWYRLWIVCIALYAILVGLFAYSDRPTLEQMQYNWVREVSDLVAKRLSSEGKETITGQEIRVRWVREGTDADVIKDLERLAAAPTEVQRPYAEEVSRINEQHRVIIDSLRLEQVKYFLKASACWLGPSLALLCFGLAVNWVGKGFRGRQA